MLITNFVGASKHSIKCFKPIQYLYVRGKANNGIGNVKLRVRLVNSENGRVDEIIPLLSLDVLGEISSMNEGFFVKRGMADNKDDFQVNVMLHPTSAVYLSNDRYLEIDIEGLISSGASCDIFGIEKPVVDKEFICRYNKFYMSTGELQKTFVVGDNENLIIPNDTFDEVILHYKNGSSCTYTFAELEAIMMLKNDLVSMPSLSVNGQVLETYANCSFVAGYASMYGLDVSDVESFSIRRSSGSNAFEFVLIDAVKE